MFGPLISHQLRALSSDEICQCAKLQIQQLLFKLGFGQVNNPQSNNQLLFHGQQQSETPLLFQGQVNRTSFFL